MPTEAPIKITPTRNTRIAGDLADKVDDLIEVLGGSAAEYLDSLIRQQIENDHKAHARAIKTLRDARAQHRKTRGEDTEG